MCLRTYRLMVDEGKAAFLNGVANYFHTAATANFVSCRWKQGWQLSQGEFPNTICRKTQVSIRCEIAYL